MFSGHDGGAASAAYSSDGTRLVTAGADGTVRIWNVASGREIAVFRHDQLSSAAFSPDGTRISHRFVGLDSAHMGRGQRQRDYGAPK